MLFDVPFQDAMFVWVHQVLLPGHRVSHSTRQTGVHNSEHVAKVRN